MLTSVMTHCMVCERALKEIVPYSEYEAIVRKILPPRTLLLGVEATAFLEQAMLDRGNHIRVSWPPLNEWLDQLEKITIRESGREFARYT